MRHAARTAAVHQAVVVLVGTLESSNESEFEVLEWHGS